MLSIFKTFISLAITRFYCQVATYHPIWFAQWAFPQTRPHGAIIVEEIKRFKPLNRFPHDVNKNQGLSVVAGEETEIEMCSQTDNMMTNVNKFL